MVPEKSPQSAKKKSTKSTSAKAAPRAKKEKVAEPLLEDVSEEREAHSEVNGNTMEAQTPVQQEKRQAPPQGHQEPRAAEQKPSAPYKEGDDYTFLVRYDRGTRLFTGSVAEISDCKTTGLSREEVLKDLKIKLEDYLEDHRHQGGLPEPIFTRQYPEKLNVTVSQSVYRKLDLLSRMEKVALDQVVVELLSSAVDRRLETGKGGQKHHQPNQPQQQRHQHHGNRHGGGHGRNRHSQGNLDSRENFMEYVRNLEKGGGNRWKK